VTIPRTAAGALAGVLLPALLAASPGAAADRVELRDGRVLEGEFLGSTSYVLRLQTAERVERVPIAAVRSLTFSSREAAANAPGPGAALAGRTMIVGAGATLPVRLLDEVDLVAGEAGREFRGELAADLTVGEVVLARAGDAVLGRTEPMYTSEGLKPVLHGIRIGDSMQRVDTGVPRLAGGAEGDLGRPLEPAVLPAGTLLVWRVRSPFTVRVDDAGADP